MSASFEHLLPTGWKKQVAFWLQEDTPSFDYGGFVVGDKPEIALLYGKSAGILAGVPFFNQVFEVLGCTVEWLIKEGDVVDPSNGKIVVARVSGPARFLLLGERPALNMLARASGIATKARLLRDIAKGANWNGIIAATRKTTPGFRVVEKYAALVGGVDQHRMDLSSMIMLKDNHIWSAGSITSAVQKARSVGGFALKIEVECGNEGDADEAIQAGADVVMLDNFDGPGIAIAAKNLKERWAGKHNFLLEGSGGLTENNASEYFCAHLDILSFGSITQSVAHVDFSLKIQHA